ncbi:MAG: SIMPL domain-containing protein [Bradyrhizobium sp.]|uniref:SIMPL domain-containing protein n=1 Tax=Bradyrhizobium sp. TaxID=376 RepID=UPI001C297B17|nr:SIMPL domain-containing protein [Bradyrhizobium sp.]MBU6463511.1 SIMPL domain-containing protein [Pseudomonadota bacterium]MDE2065949.1 SIMPL domain-containing protein [Bradyrhizobium sp.]MDE2243940.1 SIMPL domain-containing protein [Bradyrhizobium sp.]MDE2469553.1 SIMPL domain-containing protein [Bradyrhizobium sp.]
MRPVGYCALLAFAAGMLLGAPVQADSLPPAISVTGEASVSVPPDLAEVEAGVTSDAKTAHDASETNNATMGKLMLALKAASIDPKDIRTSRLSLQPQNAPNRAGSPAITGYRASNHVTVRLHDVTKLASTIDMLVGAGANDIDGINFMVSQASKLLDDARTQAVADARRKAEIYAKAAGVTLGAPLSISEGGAAVPMFRAKVATAMAPTPVAPGEETLSVTVNVTWAIKPAADQ